MVIQPIPFGQVFGCACSGITPESSLILNVDLKVREPVDFANSRE
jgi:hypothetical protein